MRRERMVTRTVLQTTAEVTCIEVITPRLNADVSIYLTNKETFGKNK